MVPLRKCSMSTYYTPRYHLFANLVNQPKWCHCSSESCIYHSPIVTEVCPSTCFFGLIQLIRAPRSFQVALSYDITVELRPRISYLIPNVETY
jgi:hypothetical protein